MPCAIDAGTNDGSLTAASGTNWTPSRNSAWMRAARAMDNLVLPEPPGPGQRQQPGAVEEAASRAEFTLPADEARPRPWHAAGYLAGARGSKTHHLSSPGRWRTAPGVARRCPQV